MGLDLYAGPLTRYYAGLWKTVVQQAAEATGREVRIVYAGGEPERPSADQARRSVLAWQEALREASGHPALQWPESADGEYFTDKPDWDGYWAVLFLAAADEFPDVEPPREVPPPSRLPDPSTQPLMKRVAAAYAPKPPSGIRRLLGRGDASAREGPRRYEHLLLDEEMWLPVDFEKPFSVEDPGGNRVRVGSSQRLLRELEGLNDRTLSGDDAKLQAWRERGPSDEDFSLRRVAEFGLAIFLEAARFSVERRVPLRLDY